MNGQMLPTQKGTTPDKTSMATVAKVAAGKVDTAKPNKKG